MGAAPAVVNDADDFVAIRAAAYGFVPEGFVPFRDAVGCVAKILFGDDLARELEESEQGRLSESHSQLTRHYLTKGQKAAFQTPPEILELGKLFMLREKQFELAKQRLRQSLHAQRVTSKALTDHGTMEDIPKHKWASADFEEMYKTGVVSFGVPHSSATVKGRIIISTTDLTRGTFAKEARVETEQANAVQPIMSTPRGKGGRPPKFNWDQIWAEICRIAYNAVPPITQAEVIRQVSDWCMRRYGESPDENTFKPKVRALFQALKLDEN